MSGTHRQPAEPGRTAIVEEVEAEVYAFGELCRILLAEQACLLRNDVDALLELAEIKSRTVERLSELAASRAAHLGDRGLLPNSAGMQQWLDSQPSADGAELDQAWGRVLALATEARALNNVNGGLIALRVNHGQAALSTLQAAAKRHSVYGPDGQSDFRPANRALGRA